MLRLNNDPVLGRVYNGQNVQIYFYEWSQIIQSAKGRMSYLKDHLQIEVSNDDTDDYFKSKYPHIFAGVEKSKEKEIEKKAKKKKTKKD